MASAKPAKHYTGLCEASAVAKLDDNHFVVASDDSEFLRIYKRGISKPIGQPYAVKSAKIKSVTDIEAAAKIGDTIFWLTSHSFSKAKPDEPAEDKPKRKRLFATSVRGLSLTPAGHAYDDFRARVVAALGRDGIGIEPMLNIEGLAASPDNGLIVGLRSPLKENAAHVVRIDNPFALVGLQPATSTAALQSRTTHFLLKLGGRGIRSIEHVGSGARSYLIVAGPSGNQDVIPPALFWWNGVGNDVTAGPKADFTGWCLRQ